MQFFFQSIRTISYWKYALFSMDSVKTYFAVLGVGWTVVSVLDFFHVYERNDYGKGAVWLLVLVGVIVVLTTRRPVDKISYKVPGRDMGIEVRIGDLFRLTGQKVISTNTTFDTDIATGIISPNSIQGQFTNKFFPQNIDKLNQEIEKALDGLTFTDHVKEKGNRRQYPIGTIVNFNIGQERFYWLAMANLNFNNTAETTLENVLISLEMLWREISLRGEMDRVVLPLIGTGRGRLSIGRKKLIGYIAESFVKASEQRTFSNKLVIVIHPDDVRNFGINLFQVKDLLGHLIG